MRLLITTWSDHKHLFGAGKATKKDVFEKIAKQFIQTSGRMVTGSQCLGKWGKLLKKQKEIEDHNNKSGNDKKSWKFYEELSQCLANDATINPVYTMESTLQLNDQHEINRSSQQNESDSDESPSESLAKATCTSESSDSSGKRSKAATKKRCRKKPKSRSSATEMLDFLQMYSEKRDKAEEGKLKLLKEMKDDKTAFFNRFFDYMDKK